MEKADEVRGSSWKMKSIYCKLSSSPDLHHCKYRGWILLQGSCLPLCWHQIFRRSMYVKNQSSLVEKSYHLKFFKKCIKLLNVISSGIYFKCCFFWNRLRVAYSKNANMFLVKEDASFSPFSFNDFFFLFTTNMNIFLLCNPILALEILVYCF